MARRRRERGCPGSPAHRPKMGSLATDPDCSTVRSVSRCWRQASGSLRSLGGEAHRERKKCAARRRPQGRWLFFVTGGVVAAVAVVALLTGAFSGGRSVDLRVIRLAASPATDHIEVTARVGGSGDEIVVETTNRGTVEVGSSRPRSPEFSRLPTAPWRCLARAARWRSIPTAP